MKTWLILTLLLSTACLSFGQLTTLRMPNQIVWVEEIAERDTGGEVSRSCTVNAIDGTDWRSESVNAQADIAISVCRGERVTSTLAPVPPASAGPAKALQELYDALKARARFEMVDIISGIGYSRYRETGPDGYTRLIWIDRAAAFPRRISTTFADGSLVEQTFRIVTVDDSIRRRLFDLGTLYPFFGHYLDEWHARVTK